jgi:MATE family multidrug resistance protein
MMMTALGIWAFPGALAGLFIDGNGAQAEQVRRLSITFLMVAAIFQIADGAQVMVASMLRGLHDTRVPMIFAAIGYWVIGIGVGIILAFPLGWGGVGIWAGLATGLAVVSLLMLGRWSRRTRLGLVPGA